MNFESIKSKHHYYWDNVQKSIFSSSLFIKLHERIELALKSEFSIKLIEHVKLTMSSRINQQILNFALIPVVLGACVINFNLIFLMFIPPFSFFGFFFISVVLINTIIIAYGIVWMIYLQFAQTEREFFLPYNYKRILKINYLLYKTILGAFAYFPAIAEYLYMRYFVGKKMEQFIKKDIYYGSSFVENKLDIYMPDNTIGSTTTNYHPVIIFFYGGGWTVGNKISQKYLGIRLSQMGYVVVIPNYTKYPKTKIDGVVSDFKRAVVWTKRSINDYGGDPNNIYLMGHSAGAHTSIFTIIRDVIYKSRNDEGKTNTELYDIDPEWDLPKISGLILSAGVYDLPKHYEFETSIGFEEISSMSRIMGNTQESLVKNSPLLLIQDIANNKHININQVKNLMPKKILIIHGSQDLLISMEQSVKFNHTLKDLSIKELKLKIYQDKDHEEIIYDIMNLSNPELVADLKEFMSV
ncbi:hypothetical protein Glove_146g47 [Diversispora epigaea]|uniref:BD-FAE-like domain-containing protein n=1 Tax=Diversispora epigaea TaxID=1348612 RepID=A0A397IXQ9_9GLOM|nr:hypothetical protein Glove_146g47 [Diversispora epigaea]